MLLLRGVNSSAAYAHVLRETFRSYKPTTLNLLFFCLYQRKTNKGSSEADAWELGDTEPHTRVVYVGSYTAVVQGVDKKPLNKTGILRRSVRSGCSDRVWGGKNPWTTVGSSTGHLGSGRAEPVPSPLLRDPIDLHVILACVGI